MSPPDDLDRLSHAELKGLVIKQWEQMVELQRMVAALRDEIARLKGGPGRPHIKPSGMERGTEPKPRVRRPQAPAGRHALEALDPRGADYQGGGAATWLAFQGLYELRGAGPGDPSARRELSLRALADAGWRHDDGGAAGRRARSFRTRPAPLRARPVSSGADDGAAPGDAVARPWHLHLQAPSGPPADRGPGRLPCRGRRGAARRAFERRLDHGRRHR